MNLTLPSEIKDKSTVKVVYLPVESDVVSLNATPQERDDCSTPCSLADTDILSSAESTSSDSSLRSQPWPLKFQIPEFSYEVQF